MTHNQRKQSSNSTCTLGIWFLTHGVRLRQAMGSVRSMARLLLLVSAWGLSSCDFYQDSKVQRTGIATENQELVSRLEAGLTAAGIPYESSRNQDGLLSVTWEVVNDPAANSILRSFDNRNPEGTSTLCFFETARFNEFTNRLGKNAIPFESVKPSPDEWCARWESEFDEKVAEVDANWREMRELENRARSSQ